MLTELIFQSNMKDIIIEYM